MASNTTVTRGQDDSLWPRKEHQDSPNKIDGIDAIVQGLSALVTGTAPAPAYQMIALG
jgi:hypothetical protein